MGKQHNAIAMQPVSANNLNNNIFTNTICNSSNFRNGGFY